MTTCTLTHATQQGDQNGEDTAANGNESEKSQRLHFEIADFGEIIEDSGEVCIDLDVYAKTDESESNEHKYNVQQEKHASGELNAARELSTHTEVFRMFTEMREDERIERQN